MKLNKLCSLVSGILSFGAIFLIDRALAAPMVFTVDNKQSQINLSGQIAGFPLTAQSAGSLTTTYSGNINADVAGSTIQFTGSSAIIAKTNGVWQPAVGGGTGSALADYGGKVSVSIFTGYGAARNIVLDMTSPLLTLTGTNFDSSALVFSFASNSSSSFDYNAVVKSGTLSLVGNSTNSVANGASLTTNGNVLKLVIQLNAQFVFSANSPGDTPLDLSGQIVATNILAAGQLIINSIALNSGNAVLTVENATESAQLQITTNLQAWLPASTTVSNYSGSMIFTTPLSGPQSFFRVKQ